VLFEAGGQLVNGHPVNASTPSVGSDPLQGLPHVARLYHRLHEALRQGSRTGGCRSGLLPSATARTSFTRLPVVEGQLPGFPLLHHCELSGQYLVPECSALLRHSFSYGGYYGLG
jgi:hypothetical protein